MAAAPLPIDDAVYVNLPCTRDDYSAIDTVAGKIDKDETIACFCGIGFRVQAAKAKLEAMGYTDVHNVGGYSDIIGLFD